MIFWTEKIDPFKAANGMQVSPAACELKDGRNGYCLGLDWKSEIEAKGGNTEFIYKSDIKQPPL